MPFAAAGSLGDLADAAGDALGVVTTSLAGASPWWLACGVLLHVGNQVARGRAWWAVVDASAGADAPVRRRAAVLAWIAGAGAGGLLTGRAGDMLRVLLLARRAPGATYSQLAGTLVAEGAGELALGSAVLAGAFAIGVGPRLVPHAPPLVWVAAAVLALLAAGLWRRRRAATTRGLPAPVARILAGVRAGCAPLASPRRYLRRVTPWQLLSRGLRIAALACFLAAFHLPVSVTAVLLVVLTLGAGQLIPFTPGSAGVSAITLASTFGPLTHTTAPSAQVAAFVIGTTTLLTVVGAALMTIIALRIAPWRTLVRGLRPARAAA